MKHASLIVLLALAASSVSCSFQPENRAHNPDAAVD